MAYGAGHLDSLGIAPAYCRTDFGRIAVVSKTIHAEQLCPVDPVPGRRRLLTVFESLGDDATGLCAANSNRSFPPELRESCLVAKVY